MWRLQQRLLVWGFSGISSQGRLREGPSYLREKDVEVNVMPTDPHHRHRGDS